MSRQLIELVWERDLTGYDLVPEQPPERSFAEKNPLFGCVMTEPSLLDMATEPARIVRRGGQVRRYRPLDLDGMPLIFAGVHTAEELLAFVSKYGLLTEAGYVAGENVDDLLRAAETFRALLSYSGGGEAALATWAGEEGKPLTGVEIELAQNPMTRNLCLRFKPRSLLSGLWLQLAQKLTGSQQFRECAYCGQWFEVGLRTGRRIDAKFCMDDHRVLFHNRSRSAKGSIRHA